MRHPHAGSRTPGGASVWSVVVAGGSGHRFGERKQFAELGGRSVLERSIVAAASVSDGVVVVVPSDAVDKVEIRRDDPAVDVVAGGSSRAGSVRCGLAALPDDCEIVLVHDAARPMASPELFAAVLAAILDGADAVVPGVPITDTIRLRSGGVVDRDELVAVQTPQGFMRSALASAHASGEEATDDATLVERNGGTVVVIEGEPANRKITDPADLVTAAALLRELGRPAMTDQPTMRVGQGFDIHPFSDDVDRPMVLGGVAFPGPGLLGHSDADVVAHAVTDALLGAAGLGDIGSHFPDTDPALAGADSIELLRLAAATVRAAGWEPQNADCSVVLDAPKLVPVRHQMQERLSEALGAPVTVKGKRPEGIGALGRSEGIACWAVALIARPTS